jgi:ABC-type sugar transport system substrate-binding protein
MTKRVWTSILAWPALAAGFTGFGCSSAAAPNNPMNSGDGGSVLAEGGTTTMCDGTKVAPLAKKTSYTVGFVQVFEVGNPWRVTNTDDMRQEAMKRGDTLVYTPPTAADAQQQAMQVQALIDQKVDAIVLCPMDATVLAPTVVNARKACIPVFTENRLLNSMLSIAGTDYVTAIGGDPTVQGKVIADWLITATSGQANIIELEGTVGSSSALGRKNGFASEILSQSGMKVLDSQSGNFTRQGGHDMAKMLLMANPTANVVFSHNDLMALGAIDAMAELTPPLVPGKDVKIVSIDGSKDGTQAIIDGKIAAIEVNDPRLGKPVFDAIAQYAAGMTILPRIITTGPVIDATSAAAYLPNAF